MKSDTRLHGVDRLRGFAAVAVAWFHLTNTYAGPVQAAGALGWLGVDCFFVVSGFVIPLSLHRAGYGLDRFPAFLARRLVRLEPPYLASIALVIGLQAASGLAPGFAGRWPNYAPDQIALHLLYLIPFSGYPWINPVYWSLAYEFGFYLAAGLLFPLLWPRSLVLTAALICAATALLHAAIPAESTSIPLFLMGIAAARRHLGRDSRIAFGAALGSAAALMAAWDASLPAAAGVATALVIARPARPVGTEQPWLGRISYALYLTHVPFGGRIVNLGRRFVAGPVQECLLSLVALGACLAFATLFHRAVERPFIRLSHRIALRRPGSEPPS